jgi:predicted transcriptional regulator of viral defense system
LETALSFYGIIPEQAFAITAVTTIKTKTYKTLQGVFFYKTIKPKLFFGYRIIPQKGRPILMAELEKALLDLLYLNPSINNIAAIKALRLNASELKKIDIKKIEQYLEIFNNQALTNRYYILTKTI